jgi:hypothetical protein
LKALLTILICVLLTILEFLGVAVLVAPKPMWRLTKSLLRRPVSRLRSHSSLHAHPSRVRGTPER